MVRGVAEAAFREPGSVVRIVCSRAGPAAACRLTSGVQQAVSRSAPALTPATPSPPLRPALQAALAIRAPARRRIRAGDDGTSKEEACRGAGADIAGADGLDADVVGLPDQGRDVTSCGQVWEGAEEAEPRRQQLLRALSMAEAGVEAAAVAGRSQGVLDESKAGLRCLESLKLLH